jgi:CRISPR system Cascade subunit CasA
MTYSFNLIDQPWIPCVQMDGHVVELSLRDTLARAHELRGIQGDSPLETAALYRLLLAVIHSVLRGPAGKREWVKLWDSKRFEKEQFGRYFKEWYSSFDLFDTEYPFYQVKANKDGRQKITNDILPDVASGTNVTLFSHTMDESRIILPSAKAARTLLVMQTMSVAGGWGMAPRESSDAPWGRGVIFLVEDNNLFGILMLNLLKYPDNAVIPSRDEDKPAWEMKDAFKPNRDHPLGYLDYLTWQNRRVSLIPEGNDNVPVVREMVISQGLKLAPSVLDPMKHYRIDEKKGYLVLRFSEERVLWRDSSALFKVHNPKTTRPPFNFIWLANLAEEEKVEMRHAYRFMALGMANDQAKISFYRHETFPLPVEYLQKDDLVAALSEALGFAELTRKSLWTAVSLMALLVISPKSDGLSWKEVSQISKDEANALYEHWGTERLFWSALEVPFLDFLQQLPNDTTALDRWKETLQRTARDALTGAERMAGESATALKAAVRARGALAGGLNKLLPELKLPKEVVNG